MLFLCRIVDSRAKASVCVTSVPLFKDLLEAALCLVVFYAEVIYSCSALTPLTQFAVF